MRPGRTLRATVAPSWRYSEARGDLLHHLYGILERPPLASRLPDAGVDDRPVLVRRLGGLVVLSTLVESTPRPTPTALSRHCEVLTAAMTPGPLFPFHYGVSVPAGALG